MPGYRPAHPAAARAYQEWQQRIRSTDGLTETPRTSASNYAENLIRGTRVEHVPDEAITYSVREETYEASTVHVGDLAVTRDPAQTADKRGGPESDIHKGSGMTWSQYIAAKEIARTSPETLDAQVSPPAGATRAPTPRPSHSTRSRPTAPPFPRTRSWPPGRAT